MFTQNPMALPTALVAAGLSLEVLSLIDIKDGENLLVNLI